ncbi:hypothetical protein K402DRAFT_458610 [Aulographum hederae CBS 113979]|uniref:Uncharacterized protein n=1 Tax=Aulographum hederae CBS 113979 TaxID=1176131 RepID=A0A6G1GIN5_9PEZI|nr:hypothetical protein K402DRAFT_458610 [Aulographum hederae CBS 113979]
MTKVLITRIEVAIGKRINVQTWRHLAVGIAIKKFSGSQGYQFDLDLPKGRHAGSSKEGDEQRKGEEEEEAVVRQAWSMPEVFHWQASHNPRTGNAIYGGTVNFGQGLTDVGLQDYR